MKRAAHFFITTLVNLLFAFTLAFASPKGDDSKGRETFMHYCAPCHGVTGQGNGVNSIYLDTQPRDLTDAKYMSSRTDENLFDAISGGGFFIYRSVLMPPWGNTLSKEEIWNLVAFIRTLQREEKEEEELEIISQTFPPPKRGDPTKGRMLFLYYCAVCHGETGQGDGLNAYNLELEPRNLTYGEYMSSRTNRDLFNVIKRGGKGVHKSMLMPSWGKTIEEEERIWDLIAFIRTLHPQVKVSPKSIDQKSLEGERLVKELNCKGCHRIGDDKSKKIAPDLSQVGDRVRGEWLYNFLKNPSTLRSIGYLPLSWSQMPSFRLSDGEAKSITSFLMTLRREKRAQPLAVKQVSQTSFTNGNGSTDLFEGKELFDRNGCIGCHRIKGRGGTIGIDLALAGARLQRDWVISWLQNPQAFRPDAPMPNFGFTDKEAALLTDYILSLYIKPETEGKERRISRNKEDIEKGKELVADLNCAGCHTIEGFKKREGIAPDLTFEGDKVKPNWLFSFLKKPHTLRPILKARMPGFMFTDEEALALIEVIMTLKNEEPYAIPEEYRYPGKVSAGLVKEGERIFTLYKCRQCHPFKGELLKEGDTGKLAPDFLDSAKRLNPDWIYQFLYDPQAIQEGVNMPSYFYSKGEPIVEEPEKQIVALRDYILSLNE